VTEIEMFYAYTPLGLAEVVGVWPNGDDPEWVTFVVATGECWTWKNEYIRRAPTSTNMRFGISPFGEINEPTWRQIKRYVAAGYLPEGYDPANVQTWASK
jgi:hypothetical protein